jgi:hypothetical protein
MRFLSWFFLIAVSAWAGETTEEQKAVAAVQRLFDAMAARDADAARAAALPDARFVSVRDGGAPTTTTIEQFAARLGTGKEPWLERMSEPKTLVHGAIAVVWASYDFHLNGKFTHCGVDSVSLVKTGGEWKVAGITYTAETKGCPAGQ